MANVERFLVAGIDPGVNTGYAKWDAQNQCFISVSTCKIHQVLFDLRDEWVVRRLGYVVFEDAHQRKVFGTRRGTKEDDARKQGAGSVKRDCTVIRDFCADLGIPVVAVSPLEKGRKVDAAYFQRAARWAGRTNEHARDAGMLVLGRGLTKGRMG